MKKVFAILSIFCLSLMAWAGTGLSYRMVVTATSGTEVVGSSSVSLSDYAAFIGGSAEIHNGQNSSAQVIQSGKVRLTSTSGYIHAILQRALTVGDIIRYENGGADQNKMFITTTATRSAGCEINPATDYTVDSKLAGATELYFWYGQSVNSATYMTQLSITTASPEVVFYDFGAEETNTTGISEATNLVNGMAVGGGGDKVAQLSKDGFTKVFNIIGKNADRALTFHVTDPCTIEVWAASTNSTARNIFLSEGSYSQTASTTCANVFGGTVDNAAVHYGTYTYTGLEDDKTMYLSADGGVNIFAVRVIYNKVRPAADLALKIDGVETTEYTIKVGQSVDVVAESSSNVVLSRSKSNESSANTLNISESANTYSVKGREVGDYTMIIKQDASADYRVAQKEITFHVMAANVDIVGLQNEGGNIGDVKVVEFADNMTLIDDLGSSTCIRYSDKGFADKKGFLLTSGHQYTITVPNNKKITKVTFTGYSNASSDPKGKIRLGSTSAYDSEIFPVYDATPGTKTYQNDATNFTFNVTGGNVVVKISVTVESGETFPVTLSHGYATFCAAEDVVLPAGLTAYVATGSNAEEILLEEVAGGIVKANTGVVLMGEDGTYDLTITTGAPALSSVLNGTVKRIANPGTAYCLNSSQGAFQQYNGAYIPANKAYFTAPAGAPARMAIRIGHVATDIDANVNVNANKILRDGQILIVRGEKMYNLQGQLVK